VPDGSVFDHREYVASWNAHFPGVVIHAEPTSSRSWCASKISLASGRNSPGWRRRRVMCCPLLVFNRKARSAYCASWGFPSSPCSFALLECLRTTCSGVLVTDTSTCVSGYAFRVGFAIKRFARRTRREVGGRHTSTGQKFLPPQNPYPPRSPSGAAPQMISLGICSPPHPICVASRPIRHTIFSGFALKIRTSFRHRNPDPTECPKHNTGIGGAHVA
jgi:hypothetical protein